MAVDSEGLSLLTHAAFAGRVVFEEVLAATLDEIGEVKVGDLGVSNGVLPSFTVGPGFVHCCLSPLSGELVSTLTSHVLHFTPRIHTPRICTLAVFGPFRRCTTS